MSSTFPTSTALPGLSIAVSRSPQPESIYRARENMRDITSPLMQYPLHEIELTFNVLRQSTVFNELQTIAGFFLSRRGSYESFLFIDPIDNASSNSQIGVGNGVNRTFQFGRQIGPSFYETVDVVNVVSQLRVGGVARGSSLYTIVYPNFVTLSTLGAVPTSTQPITADFSYYYLMRFSEDGANFEQFMKTLYLLNKCKLRSARL